jgi:hypothetical protein
MKQKATDEQIRLVDQLMNRMLDSAKPHDILLGEALKALLIEIRQVK